MMIGMDSLHRPSQVGKTEATISPNSLAVTIMLLGMMGAILLPYPQGNLSLRVSSLSVIACTESWSIWDDQAITKSDNSDKWKGSFIYVI